jgi:hypothetical protein
MHNLRIAPYAHGLLFLPVLVMCIGCASFPMVSAGGRITGGDPRLNRLLAFLLRQRDVLVLRDGNLLYVGYTAVNSLDDMTDFSSGELPATRGGPRAAGYALAASVARSHTAVVTEFVVPKCANPYTNCYRLKWDARSKDWYVAWASRPSNPPRENGREGVPTTTLAPEGQRVIPNKFYWDDTEWRTQPGRSGQQRK